MPEEEGGAGQQQPEMRATENAEAGAQRRGIDPEPVDVEGRFGEALRHIGRSPAGRPPPQLQFVAPAPGMPAVLQQGPVDLGIGPQGVPAVERAARAVDTGLVFFLEGAEQAVPEDQDAAIVPVQVGVIHRMVDAVVGGRGKDPVEPAQAGHMLGVDPVLVEQVDQGHHRELHRRHARQGHRHIEQPAQKRAAAGLAQRGREVVALALVVHHMGRPQHRHFVAQAVQPVITEVVEQQGQQPAGAAAPELRSVPERGVAVDQGVEAQAQKSHEDPAELAQNAQTEAVERVIELVGVASTRPTPGPFEGHE